MRPLLGLLLLLLCSACSSPGHLGYVAPASVQPGPPAVAEVVVTDRRDEKPNRVATIRGGYGNPLKVLDTTEPVAVQVREVFAKAMAARGMLAAGAPDRMEVVLQTLYGDQYVGRKVELMFDVIVRDPAARVIYSDRVVGKDYEFTFFDNGIFSSIDTLGKAVEATLDKAVDEALDKPALRDALARSLQGAASPIAAGS